MNVDTHTESGNTTPKHVFLHLLMIAMLYISVVASIVLYFQYINNWFFEPTFDFRTAIFDGIRWSSSVLAVSFPVLVWTTYVIHKELAAMPDRLNMKTRRWLLFFTQFVTAITIIVDIMVLIYQFYGGELTARFGLKILVVFVVAALVLGYYRWELRRGNRVSNIPKIFAVGVGGLLVTSIISGFFIAGTPSEQRAVRFDEERINDLSILQNNIVNYSISNNALPKDSTELTNWSGELPTDPDTDAPYVYTKKSKTEFELCAKFAAEQSEDNANSMYYPEIYQEKTSVNLIGGSSWKHPVGEYCFERTVDFSITK